MADREEIRVAGQPEPITHYTEVFRNIRAVLAAAGATFADIARVTVYLTSVDDRQKVNPVRQEFFGKARPASALVEVRRLAVQGARVEVEVVAMVRT